MADDSQVLRGINWRETFPVTHVFRAFRVAIEPSKLFLALVTLLLLVLGGLALDKLWPTAYSALPGEIDVFADKTYRDGGGRDFDAWRVEARKGIADRYAGMLVENMIVTDPAEAEKDAAPGAHLDALQAALLKKSDDDCAKNARDITDPTQLAVANQAVRANTYELIREAKEIKGRGLFHEFFAFEITEMYRVINGVRLSNWMGGIGNQDESGVIASAIGFFTIAPAWAIWHHTIYFILYGMFFLVIWAVFGGAIARIAAVQVAREEKLSIRVALRFSLGKFLSYAFAPVIPLLIVLFVGVLVGIGSLLGNIPWAGPVVIGVFFFLALAAGFVATLVLLGTIGGLNLMYPTVAVEGSDSFDAISRSFSYVYAKPWRMLFYTLVAVLYGSLTFLFVRFFIQTMLALAHAFVGWGMFRHTPDGDFVWQAMWPYSPARLFYHPVWYSLTWDQKTGAALVWMWVMLCLLLLGAFAISFYFSANTIVYYLMRREVDATELDDVYVEQSDEDFGEPATAAGDASVPGGASPSSAVVESSASVVVVVTPPADSPAPTEPTPPASDAPPATT